MKVVIVVVLEEVEPSCYLKEEGELVELIAKLFFSVVEVMELIL